MLHHSITKLQEEGEHRKAAKTAIEMAEWVSNHREEQEFEARLEAIERQQQDGEL